MAYNNVYALLLLLLAWLIFLLASTIFELDKFGFEIRPLYAIYKSTKLNSFITRLGRWNPKLWKIFGNIGVASFFGQVAFMLYILVQNLLRFLYVPKEASPVMPLIPGVTISLQSLPWFLAAAGVVILFHELSHGILCVVEDVPIKSAAILLSVLTFGGAVEPDEEAMKKAAVMPKLRIFASGSITNLVMGILVMIIFFFFGRILTPLAEVFLHWLYFLSINLALVNMLPIYPLDGGRMFRTYLVSMNFKGKTLERVTMFGFIALVASNLVLSLLRFGFVPL